MVSLFDDRAVVEQEVITDCADRSKGTTRHLSSAELIRDVFGAQYHLRLDRDCGWSGEVCSMHACKIAPSDSLSRSDLQP
jgi:hypothetical protein